MSGTGLHTTTDFYLISCKILGSSGQLFELRDVLIELVLFEDLFAFGISGKLIINDSINLINVMQLHGFEQLILKFDKPGFNLPIEKKFRVTNITNRTQTSFQNENYIINFCTEELLLNEQYKISKSFINKKVSEVAKTIFNEYLKIYQNLEIDETTGLRDIIIPGFKPVQALMWLCTFAIPEGAKQIGAPYVCYENKEGFKFKSILKLFQQEVYKTYFYEPKGLKSKQNPFLTDFNKELVNILRYEHIKVFDSISAARCGMFKNKLVTIDPLRLKFGEKEFKYDSYFEEAQSLESEKLNISKHNRLGETLQDSINVQKFAITTTGQPDNPYIKSKGIRINENKIEDTLPYRTAQIALFTAHRIKLLIPGDSDMHVGLVVKLKIPEISPDENKQKQADKFFAAKYLVTAVRHTLDHQGQFFTLIEVCKESLPNSQASYDNTNSIFAGF